MYKRGGWGIKKAVWLEAFSFIQRITFGVAFVWAAKAYPTVLLRGITRIKGLRNNGMLFGIYRSARLCEKNA
jgi:hypothetical protein